MAAKEAELRREEARPVIELVNNELMNSEDVLEKFAGYSKDEARVIAKHIVMNMDRIIHESQDEITALREKKKERAERRKAMQIEKRNKEIDEQFPDDGYEDDGMYGVSQFDEEDPYESGAINRDGYEQ